MIHILLSLSQKIVKVLQYSIAPLVYLQLAVDGVQPSWPQADQFQARAHFFNLDHIHACDLKHWPVNLGIPLC